jgi:hypothetical protein
METHAQRGASVYAAGYRNSGLHALRALVLDPGVKLKRKRGGKTQSSHAVELSPSLR